MPLVIERHAYVVSQVLAYKWIGALYPPITTSGKRVKSGPEQWPSNAVAVGMNGPSAATSRGSRSVVLLLRTLFVTGAAMQRLIRGAFCTAAITAVGLFDAGAGIFNGPPRAYSEAITSPAERGGEVLRVLHVEERAGEKRTGDLVRAPIFFAPGECPSLETLSLVPVDAPNTSPLVFQADDIRRGPDGGISAVHLWFALDLQAGERRRFHLVKGGQPPSTPVTSLDVRSEKGITIRTQQGSVVFGERGELKSVVAAGSTWKLGEAGGSPRVTINVPAAKDSHAREWVFDRNTSSPELEWGSGPLFAKVRTKFRADDGTTLEQVFRIPAHGREIVLSSAVFAPSSAAVVRENQLLTMPADGSADALKVAQVPAGVRSALRAEHAYTVTALLREKANDALLAVPLVIGGPNGRWTISKEGAITLHGQKNLRRGNEGEKGSLYGYWTEVRLVPVASGSTPEILWQTYRRHVQPLTAVVEEPAASVDQLHAALREIVREMKPIGWRQEAGRAVVLGDEARAMKIMAQGPEQREADVAALLRGAENARAKITNSGERKIKEHEKGRAYGRLDPYHITYTQSAAAALAVLREAPPQVSAVNLAMARGVREVGGRVDGLGNPYIDCFSRTLNMQMGPVLLGVTAGKAANDAELVAFYRDLAKSPPVLGIFGRGQRPYTGAPAKSSDQTDYLYQAICDFWLRATELLANENLDLHPLAYSRFTDCIDVLADQYHGIAAQHKDELPGLARANFFRGQAHTHRWLGWSAAPYIRLLENPDDRGLIGLTEAIRHTRSLKGRWKNWPDLTFYVLADLLVREALGRYQAPELLPPPGGLSVKRKDESPGVQLTWESREGAASHRVYRADTEGGPYVWLNSPHSAPAGEQVASTSFVDPAGKPNHLYVVTSVDPAGREGKWPESAASE